MSNTVSNLFLTNLTDCNILFLFDYFFDFQVTTWPILLRTKSQIEQD